jgi:hypothetical protein
MVPVIAPRRANLWNEVHAFEAWPNSRHRPKPVNVEFAIWRMRDSRIRHAIFTDKSGKRSRVEPAKADDAAILEPCVEIALRPVVRRPRNGCVDDDPPRANMRCALVRFHILIIDPGIADVGKGEGDNLAAIGRICEDLLIAGHRRIETDFAHSRALGAEAEAFEHHAIGQNKERRWARSGPVWKRLLLPAGDAHSNSTLVVR